MDSLRFVLCVLMLNGLVLAYPSPVVLDCDLENNKRCDSQSIFKFEYTGMNDVPNSRCKHTYKLAVTLTPHFRSFECRFYMDVPEQNKFLYTISQTTSNSGLKAQQGSAYVYGKGLDAVIYPKEIRQLSLYTENYFKYRHLHVVDGINYYRAVAYKFNDGQLHMRSTSGDELKIGHPNLFHPTSNTVYIGLNRQYGTQDSRGSGLCRLVCLGYKYGHPEASEFEAEPGKETTANPTGNTDVPTHPNIPSYP